ncbi:uncharacterized protein LOC123542918 [Mercenaria mercenaria]|uniref:uncharacterized protein LOC123542918 n=1 Tax=Mercenaria mercenaria TaxID=6596 RepID=UPI001E1DB946|nr:uncharacterized protein LOC123542918 [Mercenaria mercenaria]
MCNKCFRHHLKAKQCRNHVLVDTKRVSLIAAIKDRNASLLTTLEQDCQLLSSKITETEQKLNTELYSDSALFIQTVNCKPLVLAIKQGVSGVQTANCIKEFEFVPEKQMQHLCSSVHNFGRITTSVRKVNASLEAIKLPFGGQDKSVVLVEEPVSKSNYQEKKELKVAPLFVVGAYVRASNWMPKGTYKEHRNQPETVTTVNRNYGTCNVCVKWDATGYTGNYLTSDVKLI